MKHTPGPWKYDANDKFNPDRSYGIIRELGAKFDAEAGTEGATEVIAEVCSTEDDSDLADARLIAAAPTQFELLKAILEDLENGNLVSGDEGNETAGLVMDNIKAAIEATQ